MRAWAGSLSHATANRIRIARTGTKFPPLKYDPALPPAVAAAGTDAGGGAGVGGATLRTGTGRGAGDAYTRMAHGRGAGYAAADPLRKARRPPTLVRIPTPPLVVASFVLVASCTHEAAGACRAVRGPPARFAGRGRCGVVSQALAAL